MITTNIAEHEFFCRSVACNLATFLKKGTYPKKKFLVNLQDCNLQLCHRKDLRHDIVPNISERLISGVPHNSYSENFPKFTREHPRKYIF